MAVALMLTLLAPGWIASISGRSPGASILTGLAVEVLFVPALVVLIVALTVSIVGIPLLAAIPFLLAAFAFIWVAGFTGVAVRIGRALRGRGGLMEASVWTCLIGYTIIIGITVLAQVDGVWPWLAEPDDVADAIGGIARRVRGVDGRTRCGGDEPVRAAAHQPATDSGLTRTARSRRGPGR